eukprot:jgi/Tetstr1/443620/TSEL_031619.t1
MRYTLRRHQDNESDPSFAVEVIDPWGVKCGHIARELAMELGPQMDAAPPGTIYFVIRHGRRISNIHQISVTLYNTIPEGAM